MRTPKLFPYMLLRRAGGSMGGLKHMDIAVIAPLLREQRLLRVRQVELRVQLSDVLHKAIAMLAQDAVAKRRNLIQLRRDIHNGRLIAPSRAAAASASPRVRDALAGFMALQSALQELDARLVGVYQKEYAKSRRVFFELLQQSAFLNAMPLASDTLPYSLQKYLAAGPQLTGPVSKLERSLMEYLTRMHTKPSPFSTFASVGTAKLADTPAVSCKPASDIRLNHMIYGHLVDILTSHAVLREELMICLNNTLYRSGTQLTFISNKHNVDTLRHIVATPALEIVQDLFQSKPAWVYKDLVSHILNSGRISATAEQIKAYLRQLCDTGFLCFDIGVAETVPDWHVRFVAAMRPLEVHSPALIELTAGISMFPSDIVRYRKAGVWERTSILHVATERLRQACLRLQIEGGATDPAKQIAFTLRPKFLWYEDSIFPEPLSVPTIARPPIESLGRLIAKLEGLCACARRNVSMLEVFNARYSPSDRVPLLVFYESYYKAVKDMQQSNVPAPSPELQAWFDALVDAITLNHTATDSITIRPTDIPDPVLMHPDNAESYGAFVQIGQLKPGSSACLIVNDVTPGFGMHMSRFTYALPDAVTRRLRTYNTRSHRTVLAAETSDGSLFNAAMHQPLFAYVIQGPNGHDMADNKTRTTIKLEDIVVCFNARYQRLQLTHAVTGETIVICDVATQRTADRSSLYRLLTAFEPCDHHDLDFFRKQLNNIFQYSLPDTGAVVRPRIVYDKSVVLQRKTWRVPIDTLPRRDHVDTDVSYIVKIDKWRHALQLPTDIFMQVMGAKPQYVSFLNPFSLALFERTSCLNEGFVIITEMLPDANDIHAFAGEHCSELWMQWYV